MVSSSWSVLHVLTATKLTLGCQVEGLGWLLDAGIQVILDHHALPGVQTPGQMFTGKCVLLQILIIFTQEISTLRSYSCTNVVQFYVSILRTFYCPHYLISQLDTL